MSELKMNEIEYFVCERCGMRSIKSALCKDGMCHPCNSKWTAEKIVNELNKFPFKIGQKNFFYVMNISLSDYERPIVTKDYVFIKVDEEMKNVLNVILSLVELDIKNDVIMNSKYLFATDNLLDFERIECHLHNRFSTQSCELSKSVILGFKTNYADWSFRHKPASNILNVTTEGIDEISKLRLDCCRSSIMDEIDAQYILNQLESFVDGCLFRGVNRYYYHNDGVAASIYRNNKELFECDTLQEHEEEVVNALLSKGYYTPEQRNPISALTDLRHSGKDTCLLDFSKDFKIALFFSCQPSNDNSATIGEVFVIRESDFVSKEDIRYPNEEDFLIQPSVTEITRNRVQAQKSVFLYCHQGYLPRDKNGVKVRTLLIASKLKPAFFDYCAYTDETVYPDFYSFIENPENFMTASKRICLEKETEEKKYA